MTRPQPSEYADFYRGYVDRVPEQDVFKALEGQLAVIRRLATRVPAQDETLAYAPGKWTVRQIAGHLGDGERVFGFRALCFSRADPTPLPGFDENLYVRQASFQDVPLADLVDELALLRTANLRMLRALRPAQWALSGTANGNPITVRALAYVMAGHVRHHLHVLRERYGIDAGT